MDAPSLSMIPVDTFACLCWKFWNRIYSSKQYPGFHYKNSPGYIELRTDIAQDAMEGYVVDGHQAPLDVALKNDIDALF